MKSDLSKQNESSEKYGTELAEFTFALMEELKNADAAINALIAKIGDILTLDSVVIREMVESGKALRCSYEWNRGGHSEMLGLEHRFVDRMNDEMKASYDKNPEGVFLYSAGDSTAPIYTISQPDRIKTLLRVPLYSNSVITGCIEYIDYTGKRTWNQNAINSAKSVGKIMSSYLFGMREVDESRASLKDLVRTDVVTGLPQYDEFLSTIRNSFNPDSDMLLAVCCADLTNFKYINSKYGYEAGDRMLKMFARAVYGFFDRTIACTREYSDNFCAAIKFRPEYTDEMIANSFEKFAEYYIEHAHKQIPDNNMLVNVGICILKHDDDGVEDAIDNANFARKFARNSASDKFGKVAVFTQEMIEKRRDTLKLISNLQEALDNDEFKVFYQPKVDSRTYETVGAEALVRWIGKDGKMIYPDRFIPAFEQDGCIVKVDYRVYETIFKYLRRRLDAGLKCVPVSMNVSRVHLFSRAFISYIDFLCNKYKIPTGLLEFEITESVYVDNLPTLKYSVEHLKSKGIAISIDDFGSGYSSLDILTKVPADIIKLDKVFMKSELTKNDKIIIGTIIDMARFLGMKVLCEGVENEEQLMFLQEAGCDQIQGYYFSKPIPEDEFTRMLDASTM